MAPEIMVKNYTEKCDIWSLGVICYMLLTGTPPFFGANNREIFASTQAGKPNYSDKYWPGRSKESMAFVKSLLTCDP
jgi:calcium-dependent protein kinase